MSSKVLFQYYGKVVCSSFINIKENLTYPKAVLCVLVMISCKLVTGSIVNADNFPQSHFYESEKQYGVYQRSVETTTECATSAPNTTSIGSQSATANTQNTSAQPKGSISDLTVGSAATIPSDNAPSISGSKLYALVQHIYSAQARVQLEVNEIKRAQAVANSAQKSLEEATNNVRVITSALQSAQQEVAAAAVRAQTSQMQLAAHDQLLFAARQKVDALSSQMVGLQAEDGIGPPKNLINIQALLSQLKAPLPQNQTPTPIPPIDQSFNGEKENSDEGRSIETKGLYDYDEIYNELSN